MEAQQGSPMSMFFISFCLRTINHKIENQSEDDKNK